jgi:peptidoglycan biosynthesis protein MviN/MurJ (putative lipid II flippase)
VTGPAPATDPAAGPGGTPGRRAAAAQGVGRAAVLIGGLTVLARILGLVRTVVFAGTVKTSCLAAAYVTANQVPNVIYDIVLGGALTAVMVPVLAGPAERSASAARLGAHPDTADLGLGAPPETADLGLGAPPDTRDVAASTEVRQISSALLTWTIAILVPVSAALILASGPVISALMPSNPASGCARADLVPLASRMLEVFAPQILLYGLAVVLYGILQAHRRFTAPALAPVLSSLVVIAAYEIFVPLGRKYTSHVAGLPAAAELTLSVGTTAGVAALVLTALVPAWRLRLRVRPTFRFPQGVGRRARSLAAVGIAALIAQDASVLVVTRLANGHGQGGGAVALYSYSWQVFASVYAVLAIPVAISAFPVLSAREGAAFDDAASAATRATALASWLGAALLAGVAVPVARAFPGLHPAQAHQFAVTLAVFAPGLVGYGLVACLSRVLLADGRHAVAATIMVAGWLIVIVVDLIAVPLVQAAAVVPVLGLANTVGMTASGIALLVAVRRVRGVGSLRGTSRAIGAGLAAALAGAAVGAAISALVPATGHLLNACLAVAAGIGVLVAFGVVAFGLDAGDLRAVLTRLARMVAR